MEPTLDEVPEGAARKYFLDWLRVIAFGLLTLFHVGLLYASWGYVYKSPRIVPEVEWILILFSPWRLALLFFISGVASRFLLAKLSPGPFARDRVRRLIPVILLGMFVINPTQNYIELLTEGQIEPGYLRFWLSSYLAMEPYPGRIFPTWDHLWFLVYLFVYVLGLALLSRLWRSGFSASRPTNGISLPLLVVVPALWLGVTNFLVSEVRPATFALIDDWAVHLRSAGMFATGVACAFRDGFWDWVRNRRRTLCASACTLLAVTLVLRGIHVPSGEALQAFANGLYAWAAILTLSGFSAEHLRRNSTALTYLTVAVLPIYVLHQPVMILAAFLLFPLEIPVAIEGALLVATTAFGSLLLYEVGVRRFDSMRFLFGLKPRGRGESSPK